MADEGRLRYRARVLEALLLVALGSLLQRWVPMTRWAWLLGRAQSVPPAWSGRPVVTLREGPRTPVERAVGHAVQRAAARLPWHATCLAEAVAAQVMLRCRRKPGAVVIGLRRPEDGDRGERWPAHAWVLGPSGAALAGGRAAAGYTPTALYLATGSGLPETGLQGPRA